MSSKKISELTISNDLATNDLVEFVDVSDVSMGPGGTNKAVTLDTLVGRVVFATPGSITANKALVADSGGEIEGVSASELRRLDVPAGQWTNNKALVVDSNGRVSGVSSAQFSSLNVTAGQWVSNKALVADGDGRVAGVSSAQFGVLTVSAGTFTNNKAVVLDNTGKVANSKVSLDTVTPQLTFTGTTGSVTTTNSSIVVESGTNVGTFTHNTLKFTSGSYETSYASDKARIRSAGGNIDIDASSSPVHLRIWGGDTECYITRNSLEFVGAVAGALKILLQGLPTSQPAENFRLWVDTAAGNVLKIKLP